jgi:transglutaminase-like putative cysteine protease
MTKYTSLSLLIIILIFTEPVLFSQYKLPFGDITPAELANKPYKPDPGADAIILSDIGVASFNYVNGFYIELERDVRIQIVNSDGFGYANIEIEYFTDDRINSHRASTFNTRNGEKTETKVQKESFITENKNRQLKSLKFNFPDVHEGSVIEFSYIMRLTNTSLYTLVPWEFQSDIPTVYSSITITYPEACHYKSIISGSVTDVNTTTLRKEASVFGKSGYIITGNWSVQNMPAFRVEPYIKSRKEHLTKLSFELQSFDFPGEFYKEITPTYSDLTSKLLDWEDFGRALKVNLSQIAEKITAGSTDDLEKVKKIHKYISSNILWNGENDFTASGSLRSILKKGKGNSADINMLLIAMLRSLYIRADPVILSTRSNGSLNQYSAMLQQFNYLLAYVSIGGEFYLVDATDPLSPFNLLPKNCLNGVGRLISEYDSKFVNLKNNEKQFNSSKMILNLDPSGHLEGNFESRYSDYQAYSIRELINNEGEDGYVDIIKSSSADLDFSDIRIEYADTRDSDIIEKGRIRIVNGAEIAGDEIIFSPDLSLTRTQNPFTAVERKYPVDFACPLITECSLSINIPEGYSVVEKPGDISLALGAQDGSFIFKCNLEGNRLEISYIFNITKTIFQTSQYNDLRSFYARILKKQSELIVLKKKPITS